MSDYKVFAGELDYNGKMVQGLIAAETNRRAAELLGISTTHLRRFWERSFEVEEVKIAISQPEVLWVSSGLCCWTFQPVTPETTAEA